jgi:hypothetical protein
MAIPHEAGKMQKAKIEIGRISAKASPRQGREGKR